jgi:hypothetical protein
LLRRGGLAAARARCGVRGFGQALLGLDERRVQLLGADAKRTRSRRVANNGASATLTRAALSRSSRAMAATSASWPCRSEDGLGFGFFVEMETVCAWEPCSALVVEASAAAVPVAVSAVAAAAATAILVRLCM